MNPKLPFPDLPEGTITFLFTDIEGSTRLWEERRAEMEQALAEIWKGALGIERVGLRDKFFRVIQVGMAVAWALLTAIGWSTGGWVGALAFGAGAALVIALVYAAL